MGEERGNDPASIWPLICAPTLRDLILDGNEISVFTYGPQIGMLADSLRERARRGLDPLRTVRFGESLRCNVVEGWYSESAEDSVMVAENLMFFSNVFDSLSSTTAVQFEKHLGVGTIGTHEVIGECYDNARTHSEEEYVDSDEYL